MRDYTEPGLLDDLNARLTRLGLMLRGGFHPTPDDGAPEGVAAILLVGNAGPDLWRKSAEGLRNEPHALDEWTRRVMDQIADNLGVAVLYPFGGPPYHPFQRWAKRAEGLQSSPLGMLIHPEFGLWHAYRAALCFRDSIDVPRVEPAENPCAACPDRPCLSACPVSAFSESKGYDVPACSGFLAGPDGGDCLTRGCLARRACPVGRDFVYDPEQASFHMKAFLDARRDR